MKYKNILSLIILFLCISCHPIYPGKHTARDGHTYDVISVTIDYKRGPKGFDIKYNCEGVCGHNDMIHNAHDIMDIMHDKLEKNNYKQLLVKTSITPHERGQVDSEILFQRQDNGTWTIISQYFK